jgi:hypothetical protein
MRLNTNQSAESAIYTSDSKIDHGLKKPFQSHARGFCCYAPYEAGRWPAM